MGWKESRLRTRLPLSKSVNLGDKRDGVGGLLADSLPLRVGDGGEELLLNSVVLGNALEVGVPLGGDSLVGRRSSVGSGEGGRVGGDGLKGRRKTRSDWAEAGRKVVRRTNGSVLDGELSLVGIGAPREVVSG